MMFDYLSFFNRYGIEYAERGPSVTRDNCAIRCPWCGSSDPSTHLSISLIGRGYRCFRSPRQHAGRSPLRLVQAVLGCSWDQARAIVGIPLPGTSASDDEFGDHVLRLLRGVSNNANNAKNSCLSLPPEFQPVEDCGTGRYFADYLVEERGYEPQDIPVLQRRYDLQHCMKGAFKWRLVFPVYIDGQLVNWTGRHISKETRLRYRTLSVEPDEDNGLPAALLSIERTLWNYDAVSQGGRKLLVVEGPFDAMKLDYFGSQFGIRATCTYTKGISDTQIALLENLRDRFDEVDRVLDNDARFDTLQAQADMAHLHCGISYVPKQYKDPDSMPYRAVMEFLTC